MVDLWNATAAWIDVPGRLDPLAMRRPGCEPVNKVLVLHVFCARAPHAATIV